jgi:hypothetical protein
MGAKMEIATLGALYGPTAHLAFMRNSKNVSFKESADHVKEVHLAHRRHGRAPGDRQRRAGGEEQR